MMQIGGLLSDVARRNSFIPSSPGIFKSVSNTSTGCASSACRAFSASSASNTSKRSASARCNPSRYGRSSSTIRILGFSGWLMRARGLQQPHAFLVHRQLNTKRGAAPRVAFDVNGAAMLAHDALHDHQPEPAALLLSRVVWLRSEECRVGKES